jgi:hypothetical protein
LIGVTIASSDFEDLAVQAAKRFRLHTKTEKTIIVSTQKEKNYSEKLTLHRLLQKGETFCFFDSDLWFIKDCDLTQFENQKDFIGVHDAGCKPEYAENHFPYQDALTFGIEPQKYFNGGLFIFNHRHVKAFEYARGIMNDLIKKNGKKIIDGKPLKDFGEQTSLNYAMVKKKIPVRIISQRYNYMPFAVEHVGAEFIKDPFTIHAAGYGFDNRFPDRTAGEMKMAALNGYELKHRTERNDIYY